MGILPPQQRIADSNVCCIDNPSMLSFICVVALLWNTTTLIMSLLVMRGLIRCGGLFRSRLLLARMVVPLYQYFMTAQRVNVASMDGRALEWSGDKGLLQRKPLVIRYFLWCKSHCGTRGGNLEVQYGFLNPSIRLDKYIKIEWNYYFSGMKTVSQSLKLISSDKTFVVQSPYHDE